MFVNFSFSIDKNHTSNTVLLYLNAQVKNVKHDGNIPFDAILDIARQMRDKSMARELKGTVKEILGTAQVRSSLKKDSLILDYFYC